MLASERACLMACDGGCAGAFGKTWRKGKAKAAVEVDRLIALSTGAPPPEFAAWVEPAGYRTQQILITFPGRTSCCEPVAWIISGSFRVERSFASLMDVCVLRG